MRVRDVTSTQGTGPYHLDRALTGYASMLDAFPDGSVVDYIATDGGGTNFEIGCGMLSKFKRTLTRTVRLSSNSNNAVDWGADLKQIEVIVAGRTHSAPLGALVKLTANEVYGSGTAAVLPWDAEIYDTGGCWDGGNASRLTVPTGWRWVRLSAQLRVADHNEFVRTEIRKNGAVWDGMPEHDSGGDVVEYNYQLNTPPIPVIAGDYFEVWTADSLAGRTIVAHNNTWFCMELVA